MPANEQIDIGLVRDVSDDLMNELSGSSEDLNVLVMGCLDAAVRVLKQHNANLTNARALEILRRTLTIMERIESKG